MAKIIRWNPYREMMVVRNAMDRLATPQMLRNQASVSGLALDVAETEDEFVVEASLPGINPDDLEITYTDKLLTIKGEVTDEKDVEDRRYYLRERRYGSFCRSLSLPASVNVDNIEANYENGVLSLHLPKAEEAKPRRIAVQPVAAIEG